jgi:hypothetical protein
MLWNFTTQGCSQELDPCWKQSQWASSIYNENRVLLYHTGKTSLFLSTHWNLSRIWIWDQPRHSMRCLDLQNDIHQDSLVMNSEPVTHIYNPSYSRGRDQEDWDSKLVPANSSWNPISKIPTHKKSIPGVVQALRAPAYQV